jgi:hypothetical protein
MGEMIPRLNTTPAERSSEPVEVVSGEVSYIVELAPGVPAVEALMADLGPKIDAADYSELADLLDDAIREHGHQTIETVMLTRFNQDPTSDNKYYLDLVKGMSETQTILAVESFKDPEFEGLGQVFETISNFTEEEIRMVAEIVTPAEALASPERRRMKDSIAPLYKLVCKLRWESKAALDTDRTQYPEFWQIFDKFESMHRAVGVINTIDKTVRHNLEVKL